MKKMNNKGFSLVELIVVVLIMAIIAVALAPQVMKWVENSRKSTDVQNYGHVAEALEVSYAKEIVFKGGDAQLSITPGSAGNGAWNTAPVTATYGAASGTTLTNDAKEAIEASMIATLGSNWGQDMRMRSKRYATDTTTGETTSVWVAMRDGHLCRSQYVVEDIES
jgi:type IV pilus assembly protein PilA